MLEDHVPPFDSVIMLGDMNYRINGVIGAVTHAMSKNMFEVLQDNDQFLIENKIGRLPKFFKEGKIHFAPTYKVAKETDNYDVSARISSWTDRILYYSKEDKHLE
jgi:hypothetical protein